jgi:hypothetical protein
MTMDSIGILAAGGAIIVFLGMCILYWVERIFKNVIVKKMAEKLNNFLIFTLLFCGAIFVISILWASLNQPSAFEQCMSQANGQVDPDVIAWYEDYCSMRNL